MDTSINLNMQNLQQKEDMPKSETSGTIAQAKAQPLFTQTAETAGTIASTNTAPTNSAPASNGGSSSFSTMA